MSLWTMATSELADANVLACTLSCVGDNDSPPDMQVLARYRPVYRGCFCHPGLVPLKRGRLLPIVAWRGG